MAYDIVPEALDYIVDTGAERGTSCSDVAQRSDNLGQTGFGAGSATLERLEARERERASLIQQRWELDALRRTQTIQQNCRSWLPPLLNVSFAVSV